MAHATSYFLNDLGRKLFEKAGNPKTFYAIIRRGHNNTYILGGSGYYDALNLFITETLTIEDDLRGILGYIFPCVFFN
jgi:hypothetical protein